MRCFFLMGLLAVLLLGNGCSLWRSPVTPPPINPENAADKALAEELGENPTLENARKAYANLAARAKAAEEKVKVLEKIAQQEKMERLQAIAWWISGVCLLVGLGCVAAAIFFSLARKILLTGALASFITMALAITMAQLIPYLIWVGASLGVLGALGAVWYLWKLKQIDSEHAKVGVDALAELDKRDPNSAEDIKMLAQARQKIAGIKEVIDLQIAPYKELAKKAIQ